MKELPILFSTSMVQAIQEGKKNQTRRTAGLEKVNEDPDNWAFIHMINEVNLNTLIGQYYCVFIHKSGMNLSLKTRCQNGDHIWVREAFYASGYWISEGFTKTGKTKRRFIDNTLLFDKRTYLYEDNKPEKFETSKIFKRGSWFKRTSLFMPKVAARIWLECTGVRCERLMDIREKDAEGEGASEWNSANEIKYLKGSKSNLPKPCGPFKFSFILLWCKINGVESFDLNPWVLIYEFKRIEKP